MNEVLALDRTSGHLELRETTEQRDFPSHLAAARHSTECPCIVSRAVWFEFPSIVPTRLRFFVQARKDAIRAVSVSGECLLACDVVCSGEQVATFRISLSTEYSASGRFKMQHSLLY